MHAHRIDHALDRIESAFSRIEIALGRISPSDPAITCAVSESALADENLRLREVMTETLAEIEDWLGGIAS